MTETAMSIEDIIEAADQSGRPLVQDDCLDDDFRSTEGQAQALAEYLTLLEKWNKSMNLVGPAGWEEVFSSLVADSLHLADFLNSLDLAESPVTLDLGAGAGLPGIPLRCVWQKGIYNLVESRQKRSIFMRTALRAMKLPRTEVFQCRAEKIPPKLLPADLILSKAFMPWKDLLPFVDPMLSPTGRVVILSNDPAPASGETELLGFKVEKSLKYRAGDKEHYSWSLVRV
ncbi:16S rRNA (guanine(527)-N(7))-methyltransferase RsmG [Maridesulfovibrio sp. FT414]|uniref:16S rRNA (guanine(527)-N(7))-methyltransferase RsmG n=1 Tax=Maridesulfovibrio sp. FT414 TaxID=2979469 RepID=UPI003D805938